MPDYRVLISVSRALRAVRARKASVRSLEAGRYGVLVISPGGVGSTAVIRALSNLVSCNHDDDRDGLKHLPSPHCVPPEQRIIYIYDQSKAVLKSLRCRQITIPQRLKLQRSIRETNEFVLPMESLIDRQKRSFLDRPNTLCIKYDELFESSGQISTFIGVSLEALEKVFPKRRARIS